MNIEKISLDKIIPYINNAKEHPQEQINQIKASIKEFGFNDPIAIDENNVIIEGHGRLKAAKQLGIDEVPVIRLEHLSEVQKKQYILAHNKLTMNSGFDEDMLNLELEAIQILDGDIELTGFDIEEIDFELEDIEEDDTSEDIEEDDIPEVDEAKEPFSKRGDIYLLGSHRLMCGDSTSVEDVERLMDGKKADMVFTDPPYNTGMTSKSQVGKKFGTERLSHMFDDAYTDEEWEEFMRAFCAMYFKILKEDSVAYICLDWRRSHELIPHIKKHFKLSNLIIWDKMVHGLGSDYKYTHEFIHVCKKGKPEMDTHQGYREYSDVWHIQRKIGRDDDHATKKPLEVCARPIRHSSKKDDLVADLFGGSGSTLIACEKLGRKSNLMELMPKYIDVIVKRYNNLEKEDIKLIRDGVTYEWEQIRENFKSEC